MPLGLYTALERYAEVAMPLAWPSPLLASLAFMHSHSRRDGRSSLISVGNKTIQRRPSAAEECICDRSLV